MKIFATLLVVSTLTFSVLCLSQNTTQSNNYFARISSKESLENKKVVKTPKNNDKIMLKEHIQSAPTPKTKQNPQITTISSYREVQDKLAELKPNENALVLFDLDETLLTTSDQAGRESLAPETFWHELETKLGVPQKFLYLHSFICPKKVALEPEVIGQIFKDLEAKNIPALALTFARAGSCYHINNMIDWRHSELAEVGLSFSKQFSDHVFTSIEPDARSKAHPVLSNGVIFTSLQPKSLVLNEFLNTKELNPDKIIFFDDKIEHLEKVGALCQERGIECELFNYTGVAAISEKWNHEHIEKQMELLLAHNRWFSDHEVAAHLQAKSPAAAAYAPKNETLDSSQDTISDAVEQSLESAQPEQQP